MHAWEAIQQVLDYIEEHLSEELRMETLAQVAALSPYYFQRLFNRLVKKPVYEYIKLRRLAQAAEVLKNHEVRIGDIACDKGFSDHSSFTRAFREAYSIAPEEYRRHPVSLNHFIKPDLRLSYMTADEDAPIVTDGIVLEITRRMVAEQRVFVGVEGFVPDSELAGGKTTGVSTAGQIWEKFHRIKTSIPHLLPEGNEAGILYKGEALKGLCTYLAAAESQCEAVSDELSTYILPRGEYVVCTLEAESFDELVDSALFKAISYMGGWLRSHHLKCGEFSAEIYYGHDADSRTMELWLPVKPLHESKSKKKIWNKTDEKIVPSREILSDYVENPLWDSLIEHMEKEYQIKPLVEYSSCSMQKGWNLKFKKSGRSLCTLYPMEGYFTALIVIGEREALETEMALPTFTPGFQKLYCETKAGMGQKWLMVDVMDEKSLDDVKRCIAIRRHAQRKQVLKENTLGKLGG